MNAENILKSDVLDILFENRNNAYSAYYIRKHYNANLLKGLVTALLLFTLILLISAFKASQPVTNVFKAKPDISVCPVSFDAQPPLQPPARQKELATQKATVYHIAPLNEPVTEPIPDITDLADKKIGLTTIDGPLLGDIVTPNPGSGLQVLPVADAKEPEHIGPFDVAMVDESAEYPGGQRAMINFLLKNLHPEDDIAERLKVKIQFIVGEDGKVKDCKVLQSAGENIDQQVLRALRKMPIWKPARKNGRAVAMYFVQPVVFDMANN